MNIPIRMRRLRSTPWMRNMLQETNVSADDLIYPLFIIEGKNTRENIKSMPGIERISIDLAIKTAQEAAELGIPALAIFPVTPADKKDEQGTESYNPENLICRAIQEIKATVPTIGIIADVALDPYTTHGHDGIVNENGEILNDETINILCKQSLNQVKAGADIIAPSDMMDGRIGAIRETLEKHGYKNTAIMSYAAKFASGFYGPFRDAVGSQSILKGDKKTYQMNPGNALEALREVELDITEGADMVMVKPGMPYLDIITHVKEAYDMPTFAYHVSGEYAMLKAASQNGWLDYDVAIMESLLAFKRAGCNGILTYCALDAARLLQTN